MAFGHLGDIAAPTLVGVLLPSVGRSGVPALNTGLLAIAAISVSVLGVEARGAPSKQFLRDFE